MGQAPHVRTHKLPREGTLRKKTRPDIKPSEVAIREVLAADQGKLPGDVKFPLASQVTMDKAVGMIGAFLRKQVGLEVRQREVDMVRTAELLGDLSQGTLTKAWRESHAPQTDFTLGPRLAAFGVFLAPFMIEAFRFNARTQKWPDAVIVTPGLARALRQWEGTKLAPRRVVMGMPWVEREVIPVRASVLDAMPFYAGDFACVFARQAPGTAQAGDGVRSDRPIDLTRGIKPTKRKAPPIGMGRFEGVVPPERGR